MGKTRVEAGGVVPCMPKALAFGFANEHVSAGVIGLPAMELVPAQCGAGGSKKPCALCLKLGVAKTPMLLALGPAWACAHERPGCAIVVGQAFEQVEEPSALCNRRHALCQCRAHGLAHGGIGGKLARVQLGVASAQKEPACSLGQVLVV